MFDFIYNAKNIKSVIFFVNNNNNLVAKKNVVINYNKLLKFFINFRFSLFIKVIRIEFYVIHYFIKLSFYSFFYRSKFIFCRIIKKFFNIVNIAFNNKKFIENFVVEAVMLIFRFVFNFIAFVIILIRVAI